MSADKDPSPAPEADKDKITVRPFPESIKPAAVADKPASTKKTLTPEQFAAEITRLDRVLIGAVLVFAFIVASFPVRNSDFWMHLGTGRALVQGQYSFGTDPFAHTTAGVYWANHAWLYDLILYGFTSLIGGIDLASTGVVLVVLKALAVTLLAWVMLAVRRRGRSVWLPVACVTLSLLVMSPRLLFQPMLVSLLFLGLTIYFLAREGKPDRTPDMKWRQAIFTNSPERLYVLPVLFLLWVNLDAWFVFGPFTVALYFVGDFLQKHIAPVRTEDDTPDPREQRTLAIVLGLGIVACLLSPHHYRALVLPVELFPGVDLAPLKAERQFDGLFATALEKRYLEPELGGSVAGMAYYLLVVVGLASFILNAGGTRGWRTVTWLIFCLFGASNMRLIPFFAVVAGPITALNLQDYAAHRLGTELPVSTLGRRWALGGRTLLLLALIGLVVASWPGWLQNYAGNPTQARHGGWAVEAEPSLRRLGEQLRAWRQEGRLSAESQGFNYSVDVANYCAWFCPEQKGFLDTRYALFPGAMKDYVAVRRTLRGNEDPNMARILRERQIDHFILSGRGLDATVVNMLQNAQQFVPIYMDGRTTIMGLRHPIRGGTSPFPPLALNYQSRAFGPEAERSPAEGPARAPRELTTWDTYWKAALPRPLEGDEAFVDLIYFEAVGQANRAGQVRPWAFASAASCVGSAAGAATPAGPVLVGERAQTAVTEGLFRFRRVNADMVRQFRGQLSVAEPQLRLYLLSQDSGPPAAAIVALRTARRALRENPDDAAVYVTLARAVHHLWHSQEDHWCLTPQPGEIDARQLARLRAIIRQQPAALGQVMSPWVTRTASARRMMRQAQFVTALQHAVLSRPELPVTHDFLAELYWQMGYFDLAVDHARQAFKLRKALGPGTDTTKEAFDTKMKEEEKRVEELESELKELRTDYELTVANLPLVQRAARALYQFGLAKQSITILEQADVKTFTPAEVDLMVYLLLTTGQVEKLKGDPNEKYGVLSPNLKAAIGPRYDLFQALLSAAVGDHAQAGKSVEAFLEAYQAPAGSPLAQMLEALTFGRLVRNPLGQVLQAPVLEGHAARSDAALHREKEIADVYVLRGLIALDEGDNETAKRYFRLALKTGAWTYPFEGRPLAKRYLDLLEGKK